MDNMRILVGLYLLGLITACWGQTFCPKGWVGFGGSCYLLHTHDKYDWIESKGYCANHKAKLVTIESSEENAFILGVIKKSLTGVNDANVWIGATDDVVEGDWRWVGTDQALTFADWGPAEPNSHPLNIIEDCLVLWADYAWQWADLDCHEESFYMCELSVGDGVGIVG